MKHIHSRTFHGVAATALVALCGFLFSACGAKPETKPEAAAAEPECEGAASPDPETRIVRYLACHVKPGEALVVSELYGNVFKTPEEQKVLDRLFNTFFKIPLAIVQFKETSNRNPTLKELSDQFGFTVPGEMDVILKIMQSDPRVPQFLKRDPKTGEITEVDDGAIRSHPQFGRVLDRTVTGLTGKRAPRFATSSLSGEPLNSGSVSSGPSMLYFWFSQCPPCMETTPLLVELHAKYASKGFKILAVNADRVLELPYTDADRSAYIKKSGIQFLTAHMTPEMQKDFGGVMLYPTFLLVDSDGVVVKQLVHLQEKSALDAAIAETMAAVK